MDHRGHAAHFLERINRLDTRDAELALDLYRDDSLVKHLLSCADLPPDESRVALSLDDSREGPFIIVTRRGHFVTCLGRGMHIDANMPIVTRRAIDRTSRQASELRGLLDGAVRGERPEGRQLLLELSRAGDQLPRESFEELCAWAPLLAPLYVRGLVDAIRLMQLTFTALAAQRRGAKRCTPALRAYWRACWSMHHFLGLLGDQRDVMSELARLALESGDDASLAALIVEPMRTGVGTFALRGAWLAAKLPRVFIGPLKRAYDDCNTATALFGLGFALTALAIRHRRYRAEVQKHLAQPPEPLRGVDVSATLELFRICLQQEFIDETRDYLDRQAQNTLERHAREHRVPELCEMPVAWNTAMVYNAAPPVFATPAHLEMTVGWLSQIARSEARELYLPKTFLSNAPGFSPERALHLYETRRKLEALTERSPTRKPAPGRNTPCRCGSGKKYKRCCALH